MPVLLANTPPNVLVALLLPTVSVAVPPDRLLTTMLDVEGLGCVKLLTVTLFPSRSSTAETAPLVKTMFPVFAPLGSAAAEASCSVPCEMVVPPE